MKLHYRFVRVLLQSEAKMNEALALRLHSDETIEQMTADGDEVTLLVSCHVKEKK